MAPLLERAFGLAAAAVLVASLALVAAAPADATTDRSVPVGADVPNEYAFEGPHQPGVATVDGERYGTVQAAVDAADPGDTVRLAGRFREHVVVTTPNVTLASQPDTLAVIDGGGEGDVLTIDADDVTVRRVWVRNSGYDTADNDAGIWINGSGVAVVDSRVSAVTFGIWVDGVEHALLANNTIVGRESVYPVSNRGNAIQLWKVEDSRVRGNRLTDVRDGIYYSWSTDVVASNNTMWDLRYGVHYMYSDDCRLVNNLAFNNDVGYALMVSERLVIRNNTAVNNTGTSGHGILLKAVDHTDVIGNTLVDNEVGIYLYNSLDNQLTGNLVMDNDIGVYLAAGSVRERVVNNSFIGNGRPVQAVIGEQVAWNGSERGNYWSGAHPADVDHDGINEVRYRPAGLVEHLLYEHPQAAVFTHSPAFDAIRLAQSSFPVIESPGVVDHHPLARPPHENWRRYLDRH
ncbi:MAG: nitrous oxide reductase family maturation protein NosD [Halobacteriales archaeon]